MRPAVHSGEAPQTRPAAHRSGRFARLDPAWPLLAALGAGAAFTLAHAGFVITFEWELFTGESLNAYFADRLADGGPLYAEWTQRRLIEPIYPPGMYWIYAPFELLTGYQLWVGRSIATVSFLVAAFVAFRIARQLGCTTTEAATSGLAVFAFGIVGSSLISANRPDGLAVAFTALALLAVTVWEDRRSRRALVLAAAAATAVIVTKHNFAPVVAGLAIAVWVRDRRSAGAFVFGVGGGSIALFAIAQITSEGAFLQNMRDFTNSGYALSSLREAVEGQTLPFPNPLYAVAAVEVGIAFRHWRSARAVHWTWLTSLIVVLSAVKIGATANYWVTTAFASAALLGPALARAQKALGRPAIVAACAALALMLVPQVLDGARDLRNLPGLLSDWDTANSEAVSRIRAANGPLFADRADLAIEAGQEPVFDAPPFRGLAEEGVWDPAPVARAIRRREYAVIQSGFDLYRDPIRTYHGLPDWPPEIVLAVRDAYCPVWTSPGQDIWLYQRCRRGTG